jgi:hypothetical protein
MITLPSRPGRIWLVSFWLVISTVTGGLLGTLLSVLYAPGWFALGLALALAMGFSGLQWPKIVAIPYHAWNRLAHYFARAACLLLQGICFYIIFTAIGRAGARLKLDCSDSNESLWVSRHTLTPALYTSQYDAKATGLTRNGWIAVYFFWAIRSGNSWACCLLPFMILLWAFAPTSQDTFPTSIYTLY